MPNDQDNSPNGLTPTNEMPDIEREPETVGQVDSVDNFSNQDTTENPETPTVDGPTTNAPTEDVTSSAPEATTPSPSPSVSPFAAPTDQIEQNSPQQPKKSKKKWIIGGISAAVVALLVGGGALAYTMYQSPDKVIMDGFANLLSSSGQSGSVTGSFEYKSKDATVTVSMNGQSDQKIATGTISVKYASVSNKIDVEGSADFAGDIDSSTGYIKLNDVDKLIDTAADAYVDSMAQQYETYGQKLTTAQKKEAKKEMLKAVDPIVKKINNRWIKFAADEKDSETSKEQKCVTDAYKKLQSDNAMRDELVKMYTDNKFVIVKEELGVKDGSYGYVLDLNKDKAEAFGKNVEKSAFVKELEKCSDSQPSEQIDSSLPDEDAFKNPRFELWVSQWSHQITGVKFSGTNPDNSDETVKFEATADYSPVTDLSLPKDAVDSKELEKEFESLMMGGSSSTSTSSTNISASI
jgi:hypothetical protein